MKHICASCTSSSIEKVIKSNHKQTPEWLSKVNYLKLFVESTPLKLYSQKETTMNMTINIGIKYANRTILFWAAKPYNKNDNRLVIKNAKDAYMSHNHSFMNHGVAKCDSNGNLFIKLNCPQPYYTKEKGRTYNESYYRHIHFCVSNIKNTQWLTDVYTKVVLYSMSLKETMFEHKKQDIVLINSLPCEYYAKEHIPNSFNLPVNTVKTMTKTQLIHWFTDVIQCNYPKITQSIKSGKMAIFEVPIVVYCAHKECNASYECAMELMRKHFINVRDFEGGMKEYKKNI